MMNDAQDIRGPSPGHGPVAAKQIALRMQQPDFRSAAAELARRIDEIKKSIATVEEAKVVTQHLLRKEVSI